MYVPLGFTAPAQVLCVLALPVIASSAVFWPHLFLSALQTRAQTLQGPHRHPRRRVSWKYEQRKMKQALQALNQPHLVLWNCTGGTE